MSTKTFLIGLAATAVLLSGCGTAPVAMRPDAISKIKTVALITVSEPQAYVANDFGNPGVMFGAVGGIVAGASSANAGKNINQIAQGAGYTAGENFTRSMQAQLIKAGYSVSVIEVLREKPGELLGSYESIDAKGADAILDLAIQSIGYATEHPMFSPHWRPASIVNVALVDTRTREKLYSEKFMYGYHNPFMSGTDLDAPKAHHFKDKNSLFADSNKLIAGMQDSVSAVTHKVAENLSRQDKD